MPPQLFGSRLIGKQPDVWIIAESAMTHLAGHFDEDAGFRQTPDQVICGAWRLARETGS